MNDWNDWLSANSKLIEQDVSNLAAAPAILLKDASPPESPGVYLFLVDSEVVYVGEAKGSGGLYDRIMRKHVSGSDSHTLQRAFKAKFPDRQERREHIRSTISVKWVVIEDPDRVASVERLVIQMLKPPWNYS